MLAIIKGADRIVMEKVKIKQWEKHHYYLNSTQLYKMYPDAMTRVRRYKYGHPIRSEESQMWKENAAIPYHPRGQCYDMDKQISEIFEHQLMLKQGTRLTALIAKKPIKLKDIESALPLIVVGFVILWAVLH